MDYGKLCQEILNLDPKIRFTGVCDDTGETKYGGQREGVKNLFLPEETKESNLRALALINDCNKYKMDLTTNGVVITDAIKFVQTNKEILTTIFTTGDNNGKESNEPDHDEYKDQLEEKQEEKTGELKETTNITECTRQQGKDAST